MDRKYAMYMMTKGGEHDERKEVREGGRERCLASVIGDIGSQSSVVLVLAQVGRLSQPEGRREGEEKAAVALGGGRVPWDAVERVGVGGGGPGLG